MDGETNLKSSFKDSLILYLESVLYIASNSVFIQINNTCFFFKTDTTGDQYSYSKFLVKEEI